MNNYSWLQQRLHQLALSSQFMREMTFDIESSLVTQLNENNNHIFVSGLARSGTTILLNALYESNQFASLSYRDMPFVLAPNIWSKLSSNKIDLHFFDRAHGDGIKINTESPEAFEEVFWKTFSSEKAESVNKFKTYVKLINKRYRKNRYLSKNNQNIRRLKLILKIFPKSKILIPFRDPIQHAYSLLNQHKRFIKNSSKDKFISNYMKWIGHTEFGQKYTPIINKNLTFKNDLDINHWLEQWYLVYKRSFEDMIDQPNAHFICYEQLCKSDEYWLKILKMLDIKKTYNFSFKESHKEISLDINEQLLNKAANLYQEIKG